MSAGHQSSTTSTTTTQVELHVCPACTSGLVQPSGWEEANQPGLWHVWLRCPDCGWDGEGAFGQDEIDRFDEELDRGTREIAEELSAMERANMEEAAEVFVAALHGDLILPEDF